MGKRKRSRSKSQEKNEDLWKKLRKIEKKLKKREKGESHSRERSVHSSTPETPPPFEKVPTPSEETEDLTVEDILEELLQALGKEGESKEVVGEELQQQLADRWTNIVHQGLGKEDTEQLMKKYPTPANFPASVPSVMNQEIAAAMNEGSLKRDKRIIFRQILVGKMMVALGKALSSVLKGNLNTKTIVEQLNDSAKLAAEVYHQDSESRKFFALAGTTAVIKDAVKKVKTDEFLFSKNCGELIRTAQTVQKTGSQIKMKANQKTARQENWKSPLHPHPQHRSGQTHRPPPKARTSQQAQRAQATQKKPQQSSRQTRDKYHRY